MVPYLRPQELDAIWKILESGPCASSLSSAEKEWIALFKAVGKRDAARISGGAKTILTNNQPKQQEALKFLVAAGMAGFLMQGDKAGSLALWSTYRTGIFGAGQPDLLFSLLEANSSPAHR